MAVLQGFDVDISDIGGWSLDVHHHYNFHEGKLNCILIMLNLRGYRQYNFYQISVTFDCTC